MIKLYQYPTDWDLPNVSPFCMKMETYLRLAQIPYETVTILDPRKAPKGKLPYIDDNGQIIADSGIIIDYLKNKYSDALDSRLTLEQKAIALITRRMIEEHLYWVIIFSRWLDDAGWEMIKPLYFGELPQFMKAFVPELIRRQYIKVLYGQGIGRHHRDDVYQMGKEDVLAISTLLGDQNFMLGSEVTSLDATAYAFLANIIKIPIESPLKEYASSLPNLVTYCDRMKEKFSAAK